MKRRLYLLAVHGVECCVEVDIPVGWCGMVGFARMWEKDCGWIRAWWWEGDKLGCGVV